jgi:hypothetical protein
MAVLKAAGDAGVEAMQPKQKYLASTAKQSRGESKGSHAVSLHLMASLKADTFFNHVDANCYFCSVCVEPLEMLL